MSFKTAIENFETAAQIAETADDSYREHLALGMIELTKAMRTELRDIKSKVESTSNKVNSLR